MRKPLGWFSQQDKVGRTLYSVPWRFIGRRLYARATERRVELFCDGQLIKTHPVKAGGRQTDFADYPEEKVALHENRGQGPAPVSARWRWKQHGGERLICPQHMEQHRALATERSSADRDLDVARP